MKKLLIFLLLAIGCTEMPIKEKFDSQARAITTPPHTNAITYNWSPALSATYVASGTAFNVVNTVTPQNASVPCGQMWCQFSSDGCSHWDVTGMTATVNGITLTPVHFVADYAFYYISQHAANVNSTTDTWVLTVPAGTYRTMEFNFIEYDSLTACVPPYNQTANGGWGPGRNIGPKIIVYSVATNVITVDYQAGSWIINATEDFIDTINISGDVSGYTSTNCTGGVVDNDPLSTSLAQCIKTKTINSGGLSCTDKSYKLPTSLTINGTSRANNSTFTINGHSYKIVINHTACSAYPC